MSTKVNKTEKNVVELEFEVSCEEFEKAMQKSYIKNVKSFSIQGFRKGKVPRKMIEKLYGPAVFYDDAINFVLPEAYEIALEESKIEPVDKPEIDITQMCEDGKPLVVKATVTVKPEVSIDNYVGIEIPNIEYNVADTDIDAELATMQERNARVVSVEGRAVQQGDTAVIDFEGFLDGVPFEGGKGENHSLEIGSGQFIPGFEEQLIGANAGDDVTVGVTFPEEYHAPDLAGKAVEFKVKIHEIKEKQRPEIDDDFAKDVSEFDTLEELKADISKKLTESAEQRTKRETESAVLEKLTDLMDVEIPNAMIETQIDSIARDFDMRLSQQGMNLEKYLEYTGSDVAAFREQFKAQAENQVKVSLALEAIVAKENFEIIDADLEAEYEKIASQYKMEADKIKELLRPEDIDGIKKDLMMNKAIELVVSGAKKIESDSEPKKEKDAKKSKAKKEKE